MDVKLDADAMQSLVAKAIFDGMTSEKREELIQGAIKSLTGRQLSNEIRVPPGGLPKSIRAERRTRISGG